MVVVIRWRVIILGFLSIHSNELECRDMSGAGVRELGPTCQLVLVKEPRRDLHYLGEEGVWPGVRGHRGLTLGCERWFSVRRVLQSWPMPELYASWSYSLSSRETCSPYLEG